METLQYCGQAGFILRSVGGQSLGIDLYLSDCVERYDGYKRFTPAPVCVNKLQLDFLLASHAHYDHFDIDAIPVLMQQKHLKLFASENCKKEAQTLHLDESRITYVSCGDAVQAGDFVVQCVFCDHGAAAPDAVGFVINVDGKKVYFAGDTGLRLDKVDELMKYGPFDVAIMPINGAYGNMNEADAVELCKAIHAKVVIPCHYWCFAEHGGNPGQFAKLLHTVLPNQAYRLMSLGESISF